MTWVSDGEELGEKFRIYAGINRGDIEEEIERRIGGTKVGYYMYVYTVTGRKEKVEYEYKTLDGGEVDLEEYATWDPKWKEWRIPTNLRVIIYDFFKDKTWEDVPSAIEEINRISERMEGYVFKEPIVNVTEMERIKSLIVFEHPRHTERNCECDPWRGKIPKIVDASYKAFEVLVPRTWLRDNILWMLEGCPSVLCYRLRWTD